MQPEDLSYLQTLTNIDNHTCKDNVVEVYLTRQFGEILPLKRLEIRKRDLKDKIRIIGTQLQIDGKRYSASDVSIFSYKCDRPNAQWAQAEDNQLRPLGCANPMPRFQAYQSDYRTHEQLFSRFVSPNFQKTNQMCIDRARDQILNNVREYLEKNGGRIVSVKPVPPKSIEDRSDGNHLEWQNFEITVQQGERRFSLNLNYPLISGSSMEYSTPIYDVFGEAIPYSQRSSVARISMRSMPKNDWWYVQGSERTLKGSSAQLYNPRTKATVLDIDYSNFECNEEVAFNDQNSDDAKIHNSLSRENTKSDLPEATSPAPATPGASKQ